MTEVNPTDFAAFLIDVAQLVQAGAATGGQITFSRTSTGEYSVTAEYRCEDRRKRLGQRGVEAC